MKLKSIETFVPSGKDLEMSRQLFAEIGFNVVWETGGMVGFESGGCRFILQQNDDQAFAENFMMNVKVENLDEFWRELNAKNLPEKFGVKLKEPTEFPCGREVNMIDIAGVCWHFSENR